MTLDDILLKRSDRTIAVDQALGAAGHDMPRCTTCGHVLASRRSCAGNARCMVILEPEKLEEMLRPIAKALGLRIKVTYNDAKSAAPHSYCVDAALIPQRVTYTIDEEMFVPASRTVTAQGQVLGAVVPAHMIDLRSSVRWCRRT